MLLDISVVKMKIFDRLNYILVRNFLKTVFSCVVSSYEWFYLTFITQHNRDHYVGRNVVKGLEQIFFFFLPDEWSVHKFSSQKHFINLKGNLNVLTHHPGFINELF